MVIGGFVLDMVLVGDNFEFVLFGIIVLIIVVLFIIIIVFIGVLVIVLLGLRFFNKLDRKCIDFENNESFNYLENVVMLLSDLE